MGEYAIRQSNLRRLLKGEVLYVSALPNIRYLTGFSGSAGHLLVAPDQSTLYTDGRYRTQAQEQCRHTEVVITAGDPRPVLADNLNNQKLKQLSFESNRLDFGTYAFLNDQLSRCRLVPRDSLVEKLRLRKSDSEITAIRAAVDLNSRAFEDICEKFRPSWTEVRMAAELEYTFRMLGGEIASFPTIVASGPNAALPHAEPRNCKLQERSMVVVDQGVTLNGYSSDMTRMVARGRPKAKQNKLFQAVLEAQQTAIAAIRPGVECRTIDRQARRVLQKTTIDGVRLDTLFLHSTGHGLGLEIHEGPRIAPGQKQRLQEGMVVTIEPGVYWKGLTGIRIEDVVLVKKGGCEVLTPTPHKLRIIGQNRKN